jgi:two-component system LytT family response regulator
MLRAIIVDDESNGVTALKALIEKHTPGVKVVSATTDPLAAIELIENYRPDILFLDVSMPKMNGFEMLDNLKFKGFKLIFTTAHAEFAIKAIRNRAADYLLKPIDVDELVASIARMSTADQSVNDAKPAKNMIELHVRDGIIFIRLNDIIRLEASGSYTTFFLENNIRHLASKNLKECESLLDENKFFRTHPSHIVNIQKIERLISNDGLFVKMTDGSTADILRKHKDQLLELLKRV